MHDGRDDTANPSSWTPYERQRRLEFEERLERYRASGLLGTLSQDRHEVQ
jgi:hypothetical protein